MNAIASTISSCSEAQVGYKFDNLKKSYCEALKLTDQSGWGLDEEDLRRGSSLHEKVEKKCLFFSRLDTIWGSRPNFQPPSHFSSSAQSHEMEMAATALIEGYTTQYKGIKVDNNDNNEQQNTFLQSSSVILTSI
ncbi:hypothetical protein L873DRAFT_203263 [Choiromyces venosus 120613-1]|uniref:Uncharacterized protein n=1 Tax=Choiromyces venosus 120613-1 TaxID=1336337 RepID=A0A3N4J4V8_9PEZI|nr:hypothetical protein L873DRAFT_203263 [Choiromyces venosus 120613-1]